MVLHSGKLITLCLKPLVHFSRGMPNLRICLLSSVNPSLVLSCCKAKSDQYRSQVGGVFDLLYMIFVCVCVKEERAVLHQELKDLREQKAKQKAELEKYRECDPEVVEEMRE